MPSAPTVVSAVHWQQLCPWLLLVRAARVSLMLRVIALALVGVLLTQAGWAVVNRTLLDAADVAPLRDLAAPRIAAIPGTALFVAGMPGGGVTIDAAPPAWSLTAEAYGGPLYRGWAWAMQPLVRLYAAEGWRQWLGLGLAGGWSIAVWAFFGGAIARIAAVYLTYGETIGLWSALSAAASKWLSAAAAPALALLSIAIMALPLMIVGLLMRLSFLAVIGGLLWFVALFFGLAIAIVAVGLAFGWPLLWSTLAVERSDAFDAISRVYAYVFQRPLQALFYVIVAGVLGLLAQAAVSLLVDATLTATDWAVGIGAGESQMSEFHAPEETNRLDRIAGHSIRFWSAGFHGLADAFAMAYLWPAATGIYLLLRRLVDSTDLAEAVFDDGAPKRGLPPLVEDPETGVPRVKPTEQKPPGNPDQPPPAS